MDNHVPDYEILARYLDGELEDEERAMLEQRLLSEPSLQDELDRLTISIKGIRLYGIREQVAAIHKEESIKLQKPARVIPFRKPARMLMAVAAVFIVMLTSAVIYLSTLSGDTLYSASFVDYSVSSNRSFETNSPVKEAYQQHRYNDVITMSKQQGNETEEEKLLTGLSYLHTNQYGAAETIFSSLLNAINYAQDASYYLGLTYLKDKQYDKALAILKQIHDNPNHLYHQQVSEATITKIKWLRWKSNL